MAGVPTGLDFAAVMVLATARGADPELLSQALPDIETAILAGLSDEADDTMETE